MTVRVAKLMDEVASGLEAIEGDGLLVALGYERVGAIRFDDGAAEATKCNRVEKGSGRAALGRGELLHKHAPIIINYNTLQ